MSNPTISFTAYLVEHKKGKPDANGFAYKIKLRSADQKTVELQALGDETEVEVIVRPTGNSLPVLE